MIYLQSLLELNLRIQEFLQKTEKSKLEAIIYAKKWLQPYCVTHYSLVKKAMGVLAFPSLKISPYKVCL